MSRRKLKRCLSDVVDDDESFTHGKKKWKKREEKNGDVLERINKNKLHERVLHLDLDVDR